MLQAQAADDISRLVTKLHDRPAQVVLEFTGAGAAALAWLHSVGGSSRTILEASDRYSQSSLIDLLGYVPERFTSLETSRAMAVRAHARARFLAAPGAPVFGVGASATIATDRLKKGGHRLAVVLAGPLGLQGFELELQKGARDRSSEEVLVSRLILSAIADGKGLLKRPELDLLPGEELIATFEPTALVQEFLDGGRDSLLQERDLSLHDAPADPLLILSGSFNPLHHGHTGLAEAAGRLLDREVVFELPLQNADKPSLAAAEMQLRSSQFAGLAKVLLTRAPLFVEKVRLLPGSTFIIGVDTAARLLDERFYNGKQGLKDAFREFDELGGSFLVAGRKRAEGFASLPDLALPEHLRHLFTELKEEEFRVDISSTELRNQNVARH